MITASDFWARCRSRLDEITVADMAGLTRFAQWRLDYCKSARTSAEDAVQSAFESLLLAVESGRGRTPRLDDLVDHKAFLRYLRGVVSSKIEGFTRSPGRWIPFDELGMPSRDMSPAQNAELADLKLGLFSGLRQWADPRHLPTIAAWEQVFTESDRIPAIRGRRKYVMEVRHCSQKIAGQLDWEPQPRRGNLGISQGRDL
jgi:hypothetical protein